MAGPSREQALSFLAAANNHGDLAVKLSSLKQVKDILVSIDPSLAAELLPYLVELQSSPETLVRKTLIEVMEEIVFKAMDHSSIVMPILLSSLRDSDLIVSRQSIISGTNIFCNVLEELSLQYHQRGRVERWLEELWTWMVRFKDAVFGILLEAGSVGTKLQAMKFLEKYVLLFTSDTTDSEKFIQKALTRSGRDFNISWLVGGHPILEPVTLTSEANRCIGVLFDMLRSASNLPGSLTISVVNCLAAIARKRQLHYSSVLSALLDFDPKFETVKGGHTASVQYSLRSAFLGFLRCTSPTFLESRDRLLRALRAMNAGDAADQVIRQVDKMIRNNERAMRDLRLSKDDQQSSQQSVSGDLLRKRSMPLDNDESTHSQNVASKRSRYGPMVTSTTDSGQDSFVNGVSPKVPLLDSDLTPVEKMIAMIGALIAEGDRAVESLKMLISQIHPDLLADIVMTNLKHLPKDSPPVTRLGSFPVTQEGGSPSGLSKAMESYGSTVSSQTPLLTAHIPSSSSNAISTSLSDISASNLLPDSKRDPRRDPRRLDPRRVAVSITEDTNATQSGATQSVFDGSISMDKSAVVPVVTFDEDTSVPLMPKIENDSTIVESTVVSVTDQRAPKEEVREEEAKETVPVPEVNASLDLSLSPVHELDEDSTVPNSSDVVITEEARASSPLEADLALSPAISNMTDSEEDGPELPVLPSYVELNEEQQKKVRNLAVEQIIESYKHLEGTDISQTRMALLARVVAQIDANDDVVDMVQKHIVSDYQHQKGHELVMHVLYHLHTLMVSDSAERSSYAASVYEKFLLGVAKSLLDDLPSSDKSFSRFLGEVPFLPDSVFGLLEDICYSGNQSGKDISDGDRVTQGLAAVWALIVGRPLNRQACLDIALKCAVHSQDDIRAKAIRLVTNKLYVINYISESIEQFATNMLLLAVGQRVSDVELLQSGGSTEERKEGEIGSQETSISGSQISEPGTSENDSLKGSQSDSQSDSSVSFSKAQSLISLFFALCTKKPILLQHVFDNYARSPKAVKQAVHRHIPILLRALGSSYSELLRIISDPPEGSENLLTQVLHILLEGTTPPDDLIATVKHLYETKLKDASILIPMLSSLSKKEVLPIFPRLVDLPLDKFQRALAHILQGSAHTGPALTPAEVLVAIHDINPERDGLPLKKEGYINHTKAPFGGNLVLIDDFSHFTAKSGIAPQFMDFSKRVGTVIGEPIVQHGSQTGLKLDAISSLEITDACSACFEQRTVFTQQVLAKALNQMVDQTPLPLLFMRTIIQAIDAFPTLVDFVMELLSKLVGKQVWRMPKLWFGFLKCVSQTQPHSFQVLLKLPLPQLESALNKYSNLRGPLAAYARQPNVKASLPRLTLVLLGLANESHMQQPRLAASLHASDASSSVHGASLM